MNVLTATSLTKNYGDTAALRGVDFTLEVGESVAIMGASGSGKTTLLHCLAGILTPDAGSIVLETAAGSVRVDQLREGARSRLRRESFGFVFQQGLLVPELTAIENVALPLMLLGQSRAEAQANALPWFASLGLAGFEDRRIGQLSGGQAQRVAIARAQVTGASVVFADEPSGALDSTTAGEVIDLLVSSTTGNGRSLVVVTHDENVAARCSRTVRVRDGQVLAQEVAA